MADRSMLFSGPMVRAILDSRKSQTRRVLKPLTARQREKGHWDAQAHGGVWWIVPYHVGQRLWVRETFALTQHGKPVYRADACDQTGARWHSITPGDPEREVCWTPSIHMPRWASRLTLTVTDVRVQRLQEISEADAVAEGGPPSHASIDCISREYGYPDFSRSWFAQTWDSINGKRPGCSWDDNPWVVTVGFSAERRNIDAGAAT